MNKTAIAGTLVVALAIAFALLAEARDRKSFFTHVLVGVAVLTTLMGLGALFGKTLGDFLRSVNGR